MISIADGSVCIQTSSESVAATPSWFGEVVLLTAHLRKHGVLNKINEQVRFARRRFGHYDVIDFLAVLFGYAISGERTLEEFYERLQPFAIPFMALFERDRLPSRSALSRFLAALTEEPVEALRTLFLDDLLARPPPPTSKREGWWIERETPGWSLISTAHGKLLANVPYLRPMSFLRPFAGWVTSARLAIGAASAERLSGHEQRCRRRTVVSGWARLAIAGTGDIGRNCARGSRLDGQYGNGAVLADVASFAFVTRGKDYHLLDHPLIQARLHLPPDQFQQRRESSMVRSLYDCPEIPVGPEGMPCRVVVATHPAGKKKSPVGVTRAPTRLRTVLHEPAATRLHHLRCGRVVSASRSLMAPCECAGLGSSHLLLVFFIMRLWVPIA